MSTIKIDAEFASLIPPLSEEEFALLETSIRAEGCRDPLVSWRGTLLDGHNRLKICTRLEIPFRTVEREFVGREEARDWILQNQLGRRNLKPDQISYLRGVRYNLTKRAHGGLREASGQNVHLPKTAQALAQQYGVSERTIRRDADFAAAVDELREWAPSEAQAVITGVLTLSDAQEQAMNAIVGYLDGKPDEQDDENGPHRRLIELLRGFKIADDQPVEYYVEVYRLAEQIVNLSHAYRIDAMCRLGMCCKVLAMPPGPEQDAAAAEIPALLAEPIPGDDMLKVAGYPEAQIAALERLKEKTA